MMEDLPGKERPMTDRATIPSRSGFTLVELLVTIAIISIVAVMLIPSLIHALEKGKQKRTVAAERNIGTAWMSWVSDQVQAAAAGAAGSPDWPFGISNPNYAHTNLQASLDGSLPLPSGEPAPEYMKRVPLRDGWGNAFVFALNDTNLLADSVLAIYSGGRDGGTGNAVTSCDDDTAARPGSHGFFDYQRFDCDVIWRDGFFVQAPAGYQSLTGAQP